MRRFYVFREGQFIEVGKEETPDRHQIISDEIAPTVHPCNGEVYTSSKKFREVTKQHGCIEYGSDAKPVNNLKPAKLPDGFIEKIYSDLSVASGRNDRVTRHPNYSEYMEKLKRG